MSPSLILCALLASLFVVGTRAVTPECRWACDDPVCSAVCQSVCAKPNCTYACEAPMPNATCGAPKCSTRCVDPSNSSVSDACPACETVCQPLTCSPANAVCSPLCEETACHWYCTKPRVPTQCHAPICQLVCEQPACGGPAPLKARAAATPMSFGTIIFLTSGLLLV